MTDTHHVLDEHHDIEFESASSGASLTAPMQCSALRKNGHVLIGNRPCKIVDHSTSKPGKHGHAKVHMIALDIFTGKKLETISPATHNVDVPFVKRCEYEVQDIDDGFLNLLTGAGIPKDDVRVPEGEVGDKIREEFGRGKVILVTVISAMDEEAVVSYRERA